MKKFNKYNVYIEYDNYYTKLIIENVFKDIEIDITKHYGIWSNKNIDIKYYEPSSRSSSSKKEDSYLLKNCIFLYWKFGDDNNYDDLFEFNTKQILCDVYYYNKEDSFKKILREIPSDLLIVEFIEEIFFEYQHNKDTLCKEVHKMLNNRRYLMNFVYKHYKTRITLH